MLNRDEERTDGERSEMDPHEEFLELCAVSTSGELTEEEQKKLKAHLAECAECRQALREFEAAVDVGVPLLSSHLGDATPEECSAAETEPRSRRTSAQSVEGASKEEGAVPASPEKRGFVFALRNGESGEYAQWNYLWMPFAACVLLTAALGIYAYKAGRGSREAATRAVNSANADAQIDALEQRISDAGHDREVLQGQLAERDELIQELRRQTEQESRALNDMKAEKAKLEQSLQEDDTAKQQSTEERAEFGRKLDTTQASLQNVQAELDSERQQRARDAAQEQNLQAEIKDLSNELHEQQQTVARQDELLSHDRDIRNLMGARDLYVVDVYDVGDDGRTQKPYGRVFYTKGQSLIFYAYDLDREPGVRNANAFQAWGRRGPDNGQAVNLGIFYQDSAAKKRWVLKFSDPKALDEIDAVFVTVEPKGGSRKPSSKPLLSAYLRLPANHP
jgi:Anti-sigma-K factor rskA/Putative zinc-finger